MTDRCEYTYVYLIASGWCTVTLVYSQVLSVPAGDGGLHVQQAPRVGYSGLSEFLCKQFDPALRTDSPLVWITLGLNIVSLYKDIINNIYKQKDKNRGGGPNGILYLSVLLIQV